MHEYEPGPSWTRPNWPVAELDPVNAGLDPTEADLEPVAEKAKAAAQAAGADPDAIGRAADDSIRAMMLIRTYRVRGHLAANLDPLGLHQREIPADLTPAYHGFTDADLDRKIYLGGTLGFEQATIRQILGVLQANYCGHIGLEYMHINDLEERRFLQERIEAEEAVQFTPEGKGSILEKVIHGEQWEKFLAKKYVGTKRFGLDGGESDDPGARSGDQIWRPAGRRGDRHRHGPPRPAQRPLQRHGQALPRHLPRVRRRRHQSGRRRRLGRRQIPPRHLHRPRVRRQQGAFVAAAQPVAPRGGRSGRARQGRALQTLKGDVEGDTVLPILLHGDAAFAGQGIVAECFGFSGLPGYETGGTIHFVINNQVGFTTSPQFARSSPYPSDVAKAVQAPILHVNGDDPEAVTFCCKLAIEFRQAFNRDIVIDMWCYRRFGHNEGDEPSFTQPLMYAAIRQHPPVSQIYGQRLIAEGVIDQAGSTRPPATSPPTSKPSSRPARATCPTRPTGSGPLGGARQARRAGRSRAATSLRRSATRPKPVAARADHGPRGPQHPQDAGPHPRGQAARRSTAARASTGRPPRRWPTAAWSPKASRAPVGPGFSGRGTFSQRHAVWVDQKTARNTSR